MFVILISYQKGNGNSTVYVLHVQRRILRLVTYKLQITKETNGHLRVLYPYNTQSLRLEKILVPISCLS
jgi:hypothetical protein